MLDLWDGLSFALKGLTFVFLCLCLCLARADTLARPWLRPLTLGWGINLLGSALWLAMWYVPFPSALPYWSRLLYWSLVRSGSGVAVLGQGVVALGVVRLLRGLRGGAGGSAGVPVGSGGGAGVSEEIWPPPPNLPVS